MTGAVATLEEDGPGDMSGTPKKTSKKMRTSLMAYAFMAPALIVLVLFVFYPIIYSIPLAFTDYSAIGDTSFVGLDNFKRAFNDSEFWIAMKNSAIFVACVPVLQILSILLAVVVNTKLRGVTFFRVLFYIPVVTSMIAISIIWSFIFNPDGIINSLLLQYGWIKQPIYFLADTRYALASLMFVTIWQGLGYYMMLYLAGLQSVPEEMQEAALIDGAGKVTVFFRITLPMLKPYIWFCSLFSVLSALGVFDVVFAMTKGGPDKATMVMNLYTYNKAFGTFEFGYSAAAGLIMSVVTTVFSLTIFFYGKKGGMSYGE
ncbi:putative chitobiose transport system permease protein [Paenibacillus rhizosphaerae]|uniref:Putative chitobiose transport system permease protein n=1 Tax=Paenibacillus rhizosphaerae TaxID=297318 RepID=A0A839TT20_9BACL|nr:sugar ABC transporter permease [Paenibacillus rhizosphaerae]MBB3128429.1 putative chitobiose transport system permease protein [Paenibacillus rhizosphaerae]